MISPFLLLVCAAVLIETKNQPSDEETAIFNKGSFSFFDKELMNSFDFKKSPANWVVSSASIKTALSLVYEGASGDTTRELTAALRIDEDPEKARRQLRAFQRSLRAPSKTTEVNSANRILAKKGLQVRTNYRDILKNHYNGEAYTADFTNPKAVVKEVNDWCNAVTKGKIPELVSEGALNDRTSVLIVNAIYFNGGWQSPFDKPTNKACFYIETGECKMTDMMKVKGIFRRTIHKALNAHIVELPYKDPRYSMVILLPLQRQGLEQVARNLQHVQLFPIIEKMAYSEVAVWMPKFTIEYSASLTELLRNLKVQTMFSTQVDLSGMFKDFEVNKTQITDIIHKAKIEVSEEGTTAGAATTIYAEALSSSTDVPYRADHPFLFFIVDTMNGFLFEGKFADPTSPTTTG